MMKPFYYLSDFPERRNVGKNFVAECPKCGKKHLSISRETGLYHCFYAGCDFHGRLKDFWEERRDTVRSDAGHPYSAGASPAAKRSSGKGEPGGVAPASVGGGTAAFEVSMIPEDYKQLSPEIISKIKPLTDEPETSDPEQLAARRYLADMGISLKTAVDARIGCLMHRCFGGKDGKSGKGEKDEKSAVGMMYHCIAYVNYINGQPVNVKYRSCDVSASGYTKCWSQESPTTPCPPYNIDCINPLRIAEENVPRLIVTEGERDVLTLHEAGYPYVISVPNGAASDLSKGFEAFRPWLDRVRELVICGDCDLPGRTLVKHLADYFGTRCLFTVLPGGCKDISDVLVMYGAGVVREIIDSACPHHTSDIITVSERADEIMNVLSGNYDHGYDVGYGPLTDHVFHPTDQGGLIIATGKPNSGKTDFLNDLTCRLMAKTGRYVCYLSFEVPDKNKHMANLIRLMLGKVNTAAYTREQLQPIVSFLDGHMAHLDLHEVSPTPANIIERAERVKRAVPLKYLIIDPYLFMEVETGRYNTETQAIKAMLTQMQAWGRTNGIWVIIVAHPRSLKKLTGTNELEEIDMYSRIEQPDRSYTRLDMLKVRDQDLCRTGSVLFVRQPCGRYDERESEEQIMTEMQGKVLDKDRLPWVGLTTP